MNVINCFRVLLSLKLKCDNLLSSFVSDFNLRRHTAGQHAKNVDGLFKDNLVDRESFDRLVSYQTADMNHIAPELHGRGVHSSTFQLNLSRF